MHVEEKSVQGIVSRREFLILARVATLCVCVCVCASAVGGLCRGLRGWYVSVLLHCFLALAAHGFMRLCKVKGEAGYGNGFLGTCCPIYSRLLSRKFTLSV